MLAKRKRIIAGIVGVVILAGLVFAGQYFIRFSRYQRLMRDISFSGVDIAAVPDGVYTGAYDADFVSAEVQVCIRSGRITEVSILSHKQDRGAPAETIADRIVSEQRIDVDTVSGATNSSRVIEKAVENALTGAK